MFSQRIDMTGKRVHHWTVLEFAGLLRKKVTLWRCRCDCGVEAMVHGSNLRCESSKSCGKCLPRPIKHGALRNDAYWPEYGAWAAMVTRCYSPNAKRYADYGGR